MKYDNLYDLHTHSVHSFDGNHSCEKMCNEAVKLGLKGIAFTDHVDIDDVTFDLNDFSVNQYEKVCEAKKKFEGKLNVYAGIELGQGIFRKEESEKLMDEFDYDFVLGSIHNLENMKDFYFLHYTEESAYKLLEEYFKDELELARWNKTDSLAHLTYPLRYICGREKIEIDLSRFDDIIDEILLTLIKNEKALEINSSGLFGELQDTMPPKKYLKRFKELGGKYVTVGSDSHFYNKVGAGIDRLFDILLQCGFNEFTIFEKRVPKQIPIK